MNATDKISGEIADYVLEKELLVSYSKSVLRTTENLQSNAALVQTICGPFKYPLLIFLTPSPMPDKAARVLSKALLPQNYVAMAMVSKPGLSQFILKVIFALQHPPIPIQSFSNETDARAWLQSFKPELR